MLKVLFAALALFCAIGTAQADPDRISIDSQPSFQVPYFFPFDVFGEAKNNYDYVTVSITTNKGMQLVDVKTVPVHRKRYSVNFSIQDRTLIWQELRITATAIQVLGNGGSHTISTSINVLCVPTEIDVPWDNIEAIDPWAIPVWPG